MTAFAPPTDEEVHAYVDGALPLARHEEIAGILGQDAALAARVAAYGADRDALRQALGGILTQPLPPHWQARIEAATTRRPVLGRRQAIAAGLALVTAAGAGGALWWPKGDTILAAALAARGSGLGGEALSEGDPAARDARLAASLGLKVQAPDLHHFGFHLARLDMARPGAHIRAAQLDYRDAAGRRLTIYVRPSDGTVRFDLLRAGAARVCVWQDDVVGAVIIAPMSAGEMMRVASAAYSALNL